MMPLDGGGGGSCTSCTAPADGWAGPWAAVTCGGPWAAATWCWGAPWGAGAGGPLAAGPLMKLTTPAKKLARAVRLRKCALVRGHRSTDSRYI